MEQLSDHMRLSLSRRDWDVKRSVTQGGMGAVFYAEHIRLKTPAAVKILRPQYERDDNVLQRFQLEAQIGAKLRHPNLAQTLDMFADPDGRIYIIMEWLIGVSLDEHLRTKGPLPIQTALVYAQEACAGIAAAHAAGVIHRDIKPSNIFLETLKGEDIRVRVFDFGIAKTLDGRQDLTRTGSQLGTPAYMSPEQIENPSLVDFRTDIFSLGVTCYEMLAGTNPFAAPSVASTIFNICHRPLTESVRIPPKLFAILQRAADRNIQSRYNSVYEFASALREITTKGSWIAVHPIEEAAASIAESCPSVAHPPSVDAHPLNVPSRADANPLPSSPDTTHSRKSLLDLVPALLLAIVLYVLSLVNAVQVENTLRNLSGAVVIGVCITAGVIIALVIRLMSAQKIRYALAYTTCCLAVIGLVELLALFDGYVLDRPWRYLASRRYYHSLLVDSSSFWILTLLPTLVFSLRIEGRAKQPSIKSTEHR